MRRSAVALALAVAVTASTASTAVAAFAQPTVSAAKASTGKPVKPSKPSKPKKFAVSGSITAVAAAGGTITVAAKGGTKGARNSTVTVAVPSDARIIVNGARKSLADIAAGYRVTVVGFQTATAYTAVLVQARGAKVRPAPTTGPTTPSVTPPVVPATPEPSESESPEPTPTDTDA